MKAACRFWKIHIWIRYKWT